MNNTTIVVGAGFNFDSGAEVGPIYAESLNGPFKFVCRYPLMKELVPLCFPERQNEVCQSIEEWFQQSNESGNMKPLRHLYDELMKADYYLVPRLVDPDRGIDSPYSRFFNHFLQADFITFNYDSFVEISLHRLGRWTPVDGYGVSVLVCTSTAVSEKVSIPEYSQNLVLHIHGSLCVYESDFTFSEADRAGIHWLKQKPETEFLFDPDSLSHLFFPWERVIQPFLGLDPLETRVVAPVPQKAKGLKAVFVNKVRERAADVIRNADRVVAVGYSFNPVDCESYEFILQELSGKHNSVLFIVAPSAADIAIRLRTSFSRIDFKPIEMRFSEWASNGFKL